MRDRNRNHLGMIYLSVPLCVHMDVLERDDRSLSRHHNQQLHTASHPLLVTFTETEEGENNGRDWSFEALIAEKTKRVGLGKQKGREVYTAEAYCGVRSTIQLLQKRFLQVIENICF